MQKSDDSPKKKPALLAGQPAEAALETRVRHEKVQASPDSDHSRFDNSRELREHGPKRSDFDPANERIARFTGWLTLVACMQFIVLGLQGYFGWRAADTATRGVEDARNAFRTDERAYVTIRSDSTTQFVPGGRAVLVFNLKNGGKTPAMFDKVTCQIDVSDPPSSTTVTLPITSANLGPSEEGGFPLVLNQPALLEKTVAKILKGTVDFRVTVQADYTTIFGDKRFAHGTFQYQAALASIKGASALGMVEASGD